VFMVFSLEDCTHVHGIFFDRSPWQGGRTSAILALAEVAAIEFTVVSPSSAEPSRWPGARRLGADLGDERHFGRTRWLVPPIVFRFPSEICPTRQVIFFAFATRWQCDSRCCDLRCQLPAIELVW